MGEVKADTLASIEMEQAKEYFKRPTADNNNTSLYDHFIRVLTTLLDRCPENALGIIENISKECKSTDAAKLTEDELAQIDQRVLSAAFLAQRLFQRDVEREPGDMDNDEELETALPNLIDLNFFFEQAAVGLAPEEMFQVLLALKALVDSKPLQTVRFWGKIFGLENNYYIAEVDYREGALEEEEEEDGEKEEEEGKEKEEEKEEEEEANEEDELPKPDWKEPVVIPKEEYRSGTNKYIYYAANTLGGAWVKLPRVTPAEIVAARQIKKFFTGRLDAPIVSYPPFPGNESNYLRAQIARITANAHISPAGYYIFEDEEEEEEEEVRETYVVNPEFEGVNPRELMDTTVNSWVHHCMNILPQGRCTWFNPVAKTENEFEDDEEEVEEEEAEQAHPETGPPLLASVHEDDAIDGLPAWTPYLSSNFLPQYAVACMRSNRWPGAYAFARDVKFENIYVGWGNKYTPHGYTPPALPNVMAEYPIGPEIIEMDDPTVEEERAAKAAEEEVMGTGDQGDEGEDEDDDD